VSEPPETPLTGGRITTGVVRVGNTVRRPIKQGNVDVSALLLHFEASGFAGVPRYLGTDPKHRAILTFIDGQVPTDLGHFSDPQLAAAARLLRRFHDASIGFVGLTPGAEVICHNDFGPPNAVLRDDIPVAMIDFDTAAPGSRLWDLGYSAMSWLDLGDEGYSGPEQIRRLNHFVAAYDHEGCTPALVAVHAVARQVRLAAQGIELGDHAMRPWATDAALWISKNMVEQMNPSGLQPPHTGT
jgi:hypothetical protein